MAWGRLAIVLVSPRSSVALPGILPVDSEPIIIPLTLGRDQRQVLKAVYYKVIGLKFRRLFSTNGSADLCIDCSERLGVFANGTKKQGNCRAPASY